MDASPAILGFFAKKSSFHGDFLTSGYGSFWRGVVEYRKGYDEVMALHPEEGRREEAFCEEVFGVRRSFILVVFAFLLGIWAVWGMAASAAERRFPSIRCAVDVPEGWEVEEDEESATVSLTAPDEDAVVMLTGIDEPGMSVSEIAEQIAREAGADKPEPSGGGYRFSFTDKDGFSCRGIVMGDEKFVSMITLLGQHQAFESIVRSIRGLD